MIRGYPAVPVFAGGFTAGLAQRTFGRDGPGRDTAAPRPAFAAGLRGSFYRGILPQVERQGGTHKGMNIGRAAHAP
jgi:hypothetical protein